MGDADNFTGIPAADLLMLKNVLSSAEKHNVKVVLTMFSLPGARNRQDNGHKSDYRLWNEARYQAQALAFWKQLAEELKDHPAIVAYNPLNEPHPAREYDVNDESDEGKIDAWFTKHQNGLNDLNRFNKLMVDAIRSVDKTTYIILNGWFHSSIRGLKYITPVDDDKTLYAFHFYGPWEFSTFRINKGRFSYPDRMPNPEGGAKATIAWKHDKIASSMGEVLAWSNEFAIPSNRIIAEEFGIDRRVGGAKEFLSDTVAAINRHDWHWAFYSFRSSEWGGMDYELGTKKLNNRYWKALEEGALHSDSVIRTNNSLWRELQKEFR